MQDQTIRYYRPPGLNGVELLRLADSGLGMEAHLHDSYVFWFTSSGAERFELPSETGILQPDSFSIVAPGDVHANHAFERSRTLFSIYIPTSVLGNVFFPDDFGVAGLDFRTGVYRDKHGRSILSDLHHLLMLNNDAMAVQAAFVEAMGILAACHGIPKAQKKMRRDSGRAGLAVEIMHDRLADSLSLIDLAHVCGCTQHHLIRVFRAAYGLSPHAYLMKIRLERAREYIAARMTLADVATQCGFTDQSHLTRHFRRRFGLTPGQYRQQINSVQEVDGRMS